jgi:gluconate kinase
MLWSTQIPKNCEKPRKISTSRFLVCRILTMRKILREKYAQMMLVFLENFETYANRCQWDQTQCVR